MSSASNSTGVVGKWGQASFTSKSALTPKNHRKFFTSRNASDDATLTPKASSQIGRSNVTASGGRSGNRPNHSNFSVAVRVRPDTGESLVQVNQDQGELFVNHGSRSFRFDLVLGQGSSQDQVYELAVSPVVEKFLNFVDGENTEEEDAALNAAVLAYGQTGSGKTYTMGTHYVEKDDLATSSIDHRGVIPRVLANIFRRVAECVDECVVKVSYLEIQSEVFDLLNTSGMKVPLRIRESGKDFVLPQLTSKLVRSVQEALDCLEKGAQLRSTGQTAQNEQSSRSHAIFRISVTNGDNITRKISLVDLAGSESCDRAQSMGDRRKEGIQINQSLSALGRCVLAISNGSDYVPFRDSSLTKVLRECFVGASLTAMIACISPTEVDLSETVETLRYADQVKMMQKPQIPPHILELAKINAAAQQRLHRLIPSTPGSKRAASLNHTIETPTPTKKSRGYLDVTPRMNSSLDTPARTLDASNFLATSTVTRGLISKAPSLETITDEDVADLSSIRGNSSFDSTSTKVEYNSRSVLTDASEVKSLFSPMLRKLREDVRQDLRQEFKDTLKSHMEASFNWTHLSKTATTARRDVRRMTSSPLRCSPRLNANKENEFSPMDDTIVAGPAFSSGLRKQRGGEEVKDVAPLSTPKGLSDITNKRKSNHLRMVANTASPELATVKRKESPPRLSMEEMAKSMGVDINSPSLLYTSSRKMPLACSVVDRTPLLVKRSVRRTTMLRPELEHTLRGMKAAVEDAELNRMRRRSIRIANISSSNVDDDERCRQQNRRFNFVSQSRHNQTILDLLNTGSLEVLKSAFPGVGCKTAIILHTYRELNNGFTTLEDLKKVSLPKSFFDKFCSKNQIVL